MPEIPHTKEYPDNFDLNYLHPDQHLDLVGYGSRGSPGPLLEFRCRCEQVGGTNYLIMESGEQNAITKAFLIQKYGDAPIRFKKKATSGPEGPNNLLSVAVPSGKSGSDLMMFKDDRTGKDEASLLILHDIQSLTGPY